ncbi:MAG: dihydropyrimidinase [Acidimicrobiia bacterium]|nr:dihydropyrimidinase [Acidimicrobiia bacterium]MDH4306725.1 dihydropyrimidinase [Acidimicrobiia bacterium]MDH5294825.1 dihydropyrimidinase [Acidimicrobiia bacterium]
MRTLIQNGTVVTHAGRVGADILIEGEVVVAMAAPGSHDWTADKVIDAAGKYVFPGGVDVHTHMELPFGGTYASDDFETGTRAAAWGGTTTIVDFAVQTIGEPMMDGYEAWRAKADGRCAIDYGMHMIVSDVNDQSLKEMDILMGDGVTSFKLFMAYPGVLYSNDGQIFRAMQKASENGGTIMMHAENGIVIDVLREQAIAKGQTDPIYHSTTRPPITEAEATHRAIAYAELAGCPLYVVHMSAKEAVAEVAAARDRGSNVFGETCPQYLYLGWNNLKEPGFDGAKYVCSTPVRNWEEEHQEWLWKYLATNDLQVISTDHCPFCMNDHPTLGTQKRLGEGDFTKIPNGLPGVEERMRLIYDGAVSDGRMSLERFVEVCATTPAKMFGMYPKKGTIAIGSDADIVIWNPEVTSMMSVDVNHMNVDYSCYEGKEVQGKIELVMSRGNVLIENDTYLGKPGDGRFIERDTNQYLI